MISVMPWRAKCSIRYSITGLPKIGTMGLGRSRVSGRTLVPCPAAKIMPFAIASLAFKVQKLCETAEGSPTSWPRSLPRNKGCLTRTEA